MFVRLRTSATNLALVDQAVAAWTAAQVPVVITFMAYYDHEPQCAGGPDLQGASATSGACGTSIPTGARPRSSCAGSCPATPATGW